jgi:single-stranded-DNA-specific exonuclease
VAPFGNGNPSPLFMAKGVQITAVFPVSDGKHVRIKMRQGNHISQGIMFNVSPGEFAYKPGDYIDACFSLSIFQSENGDMVSMRIKEVRPVGMVEKMIDDYDIYRLFINDFNLSDSKKELLCPQRSDVALIYRKIMAEKVNCDDLRPLFCAFNGMSSGKIQVIIDVLLDLGLIEPVRTDIINYYDKKACKNILQKQYNASKKQQRHKFCYK